MAHQVSSFNHQQNFHQKATAKLAPCKTWWPDKLQTVKNNQLFMQFNQTLVAGAQEV